MISLIPSKTPKYTVTLLKVRLLFTVHEDLICWRYVGFHRTAVGLFLCVHLRPEGLPLRSDNTSLIPAAAARQH